MRRHLASLARRPARRRGRRACRPSRGRWQTPARRPRSERGGAAATVETLATQAAIDTLRARRQRRRRGRRRRRGARRHRAVLVRDRRRRLHGHLPRERRGKVITIDGRETRAGRDAPRLLLGERNVRSPSTTRATAVSPSACPEPSRRGTRRSSATARSRSRRRSRRRSGSRATASSSTRRSSTRRRPTSTGSTTSPRSAALYLDPDGTPHDVGTVFRNPDLARTYERIARPRREGLLPRARSQKRSSRPCRTRSSRRPPTTPGGRDS